MATITVNGGSVRIQASPAKIVPTSTLIVDIVGHYGQDQVWTGQNHVPNQFKDRPFRHVGGPQPAFSCNGWIRQRNNNDLGDLPEFRCMDCGLKFEFEIAKGLTFALAHRYALWYAVVEHLRGNIDHIHGGVKTYASPSSFLTFKDGFLLIRDFVKEATPKPESLVTRLGIHLVRDVESIRSLQTALAALHQTRKFFPNKKVAKAVVSIEKVLQGLTKFDTITYF